jgi:hypothetical protein
MNLNPQSFNPRYNRDFRIDDNCPKGEMRGGLPYNPPIGFMRFGLNVFGKYDKHDPTQEWLGMSNTPGEWAIFYYGTRSGSVDPITKTPLQNGSTNAYGDGIYCTQSIDTAASYAKSRGPITIDTVDGPKQFIYVFMCRVNVKAIHECPSGDCDETKDSKWTVHKTINRSEDYWFVNQNNQNFENIRTYGFLINEL